MNNNRGFYFLIGFALGGAVGAAITLLMAPASGEETRGQIRARSSELKNRGEELGNETITQAQKMVDQSQQRVSDAQERTGLALEEQKARVAEALDAGKQAVSKRTDELLHRS